MKYDRLLTLVALLLVPTLVSAQTGSGRLAGTVLDERGRPIKGATVTAENENYFPKSLTSATDAKGRFSVLGLRTATYKITVRADGYEVAAVNLPVRMAQPNPPLDIRLIRKIDPGPPPLLANADAARLQQELDAAAELAVRGKTDEAIAAYRRILGATPALTSINLQIGYLCERKGDRGAAIAAYEDALKADPSSITARDALTRLRQ
jgi:tetratricopeptide (TPR) repeat protein